tara:strand:+ start:248 stop:529 length:282 start_codon:yes stop_codon:yes gene_type:complete
VSAVTKLNTQGKLPNKQTRSKTTKQSRQWQNRVKIKATQIRVKINTNHKCMSQYYLKEYEDPMKICGLTKHLRASNQNRLLPSTFKKILTAIS